MKKQRALLAASVAGLIAALGMSGGARQAQADEHGGEALGGDTVPCYGINKCQGTGNCAGTGHSCHGQNACEGQGYIDLSEDDCLRIKDGRLTPELEPEAGA